jgi:mannose-6-phosphate isomerase-like protein (cupin superfamily)
MAGPHSRINLANVGDAAQANGFGDRWEARVARADLVTDKTGKKNFSLLPGNSSRCVQLNRRAVEVWVILGGNGRMKLGEEIFDVRALDAVRVAPEVARAFEAGPEGLEFIAFGPHYDADGERVEDNWVD